MTNKLDIYNKLVELGIRGSDVTEVMSERAYFKDSIKQYLEERNLKFYHGDLPFELLKECITLNWVSDDVDFTLKDRVVVPIYLPNGELSTLVGWRRGASKYLTIPDESFSKESHWYNLDRALEKSFNKGSILPRCVIVVEGIFDCIMLDYLDLPVVATMGSDVNEFKGATLNIFDKVICCPDNDYVGKKAQKNWKVPSTSSFVYLERKILDLGGGLVKTIKDIDDFVNWYPDEQIIELFKGISLEPVGKTTTVEL